MLFNAASSPSLKEAFLLNSVGGFDFDTVSTCLKNLFQHICSFENKILSSSKINCCTTINDDTLIFGHCDSTITAFSVDLKTKEFKLGLVHDLPTLPKNIL